MTTMLRSIASLLLGAMAISTALVLSAAPAAACTCTTGDDGAAFKDADAVFLASVDAIYPARSGSSANPEVVILRVSDVYKGDVDRLQGVATPADGGSCGFDFVTNEAYVVFATLSGVLDLDDGFYEVNLCSGTRLLSEGEFVIEAAPKIPADNGPPTFAAINDQLGDSRSSLWPELSILAAVLAFVLGLAGLFSWRDQRARNTRES
jgi:hypothetical protein